MSQILYVFCAFVLLSCLEEQVLAPGPLLATEHEQTTIIVTPD
ncbi:hypothetical protein T265_13179, partial [Opisthorchis viverrini]